jgi:hypothetical protein
VAEERGAKAFHHNVYVMLIDPKAATHPLMLRPNPKRDLSKPYVYVGAAPEHRSPDLRRRVSWLVRPRDSRAGHASPKDCIAASHLAISRVSSSGLAARPMGAGAFPPLAQLQ